MGIIEIVGSKKNLSIDNNLSNYNKREITRKSSIPKKNFNAKVEIILVIRKIISLDYERERVYFYDQENNLYFYETDFGDEMKTGEKYEINLNRYTSKKMKVE